jgi:PAS domain S-box-containing protein
LGVYRELYDHAPIAYHEIDRNGIVTRVNRAECELLGRTAEELVGVPVWALLTPEQRPAAAAAIQQKLANPDALAERFSGPADHQSS